MKRASIFALLVGVTLLSSAAHAQLGVTTANLNATADVSAVLEFDVLDGSIECGSVAVGDSGCPNAADGDANLLVRSNSDWALTLDDFGGAGVDTVTLFVDDFARIGQFIMDLTNTAPTGVAGPDTSSTISGSIRGTGGDSEIIDQTDDFGAYLGEFSVTLTATN